MCKNAIDIQKKLHGSSCSAAREVLQREMGSLLRLVIDMHDFYA